MNGVFASEKARIKAPTLSTRNSMPVKHLLGPEGDIGGRLPWGPGSTCKFYVSENQCLIASIYI